MYLTPQYAILLDGAFVTKKLAARQKRFPSAHEIISETTRIRGHEALQDLKLLRIYFYDAFPATGSTNNPSDGTPLVLGKSKVHRNNTQLQQKLELEPDFALRRGVAQLTGSQKSAGQWTLGERALADLIKTKRNLKAKDLVPRIIQKGVDLRIGLDIAQLALKRLVGTIVIVTGDSDMIPALKFARREGIRVYLDHMKHGINEI